MEASNRTRRSSTSDMIATPVNSVIAEERWNNVLLLAGAPGSTLARPWLAFFTLLPFSMTVIERPGIFRAAISSMKSRFTWSAPAGGCWGSDTGITAIEAIALICLLSISQIWYAEL